MAESFEKKECQICGKMILDLTLHMKVHSDIKPFKCEICDKEFKRKNELTAHQKYHTGAKPFKCKLCSKGFGSSSNLAMHMRTHTGV